MNPPRTISVEPRPITPLADLVGEERIQELTTTLASVASRARRRTLWQINSTASGGGVAEMLHGLVGYLRDLDVDVRWLVIDGDDGFFDLTKRLHNRAHGAESGPALCEADAAHYEQVSRRNAEQVADLVRPGDLVVLHDPQTAGLAPTLTDLGAIVVWRCHIGSDDRTPVTESVWRFLRPHLSAAHAYVFTRERYRPSFVPDASTWIIPPSIDPFAVKNIDLDPATVDCVLTAAGLLDGSAPDPARTRFTRPDGTTGEITRRATVVAETLPAAGEPLILQVSRWDRLKDMAGVMTAFAEHVAPQQDGCLVLAGPAVDDVSDDPEGAQVYDECRTAWQKLPVALRQRIMLAALPMDDLDENAVMVNALQRHASVVVQKSLAEGFGLTVAEAMWKRRPVVASRLGGIADQIQTGCGLLVDPQDLPAFGKAVRQLLDDPVAADAMGEEAHRHVRRSFLADTQLLHWVRLFDVLLT